MPRVTDCPLSQDAVVVLGARFLVADRVAHGRRIQQGAEVQLLQDAVDALSDVLLSGGPGQIGRAHV